MLTTKYTLRMRPVITSKVWPSVFVFLHCTASFPRAVRFVLPREQAFGFSFPMRISRNCFSSPDVREKWHMPCELLWTCIFDTTAPPNTLTALPAENHGHVAGVCAAHVTDESSRTRKTIRIRVLSGLRLGRSQLLRFQNLPALFENVKPVRIEISKLVHLSAQPSHFDQIDFLGLLQPEVQA